MAREVHDTGSVDSGHQRLEAAAHDATDPVVPRDDAVYAVGGADPFERQTARELYLDAVHSDIVQLLEARDLDQPPGADDADPVADVLHLGEDVRGEKDGRPFRTRFADHGVELLLVERIEAAGGLVENQQLRAVHERDDQRQFLLVAATVLAESLRKVELQPVAELLNLGMVDAAAHAPR